MAKRRLALALAASFALSSASALAGTTVAPRLVRSGSLVRIERGDTAYGFDSAWRVESLWRRDRSGAWERVASPEEATLAPLRRILLLRLESSSLAAIPAEGKTEIQLLKSMGYL